MFWQGDPRTRHNLLGFVVIVVVARIVHSGLGSGISDSRNASSIIVKAFVVRRCYLRTSGEMIGSSSSDEKSAVPDDSTIARNIIISERAREGERDAERRKREGGVRYG